MVTMAIKDTGMFSFQGQTRRQITVEEIIGWLM